MEAQASRGSSQQQEQELKNPDQNKVTPVVNNPESPIKEAVKEAGDACYQKVRLLFAPKQELSNQPKIALHRSWIYYLEKPPLETISMTLRKYNVGNLEATAPKYRIYRVREDPKTKYRYVTEILTVEEGRQLIGGGTRKGCQVLITHHSMVRNPQEDFKNLLDEAERQTIRARSAAKGKDPDADDGLVWRRKEDGKDPEPMTQSQSAIGHVGSQQSDTSSQRSDHGVQAPRRRAAITQRRVSATGGPEEIFPGNELNEFRAAYPQIEFCGRANDLYRCEGALNYIKETSRTVYANLDSLQTQLVESLNKIHRRMTGEGNYAKGNDVQEIYEYRVTSSYVNVRCKISRKCRFMVWYKFEGSGDNPHSVCWFRTINNNHDLIHHRNEGVF